MQKNIHSKKGQLIGTDDGEHTATFILTTETTDRDGETVDPSGGDFKDYEKNPVVAFNHNTDDFPIGRTVKLWNEEVGEGTGYPQAGGKKRPALLGKVQFSKANPKGDLAYQMVKEGTLTGCSISFLPQGNPEKNANGGNHYPKWKLLEWSVCPVGSNPDAIKLKKKEQQIPVPAGARAEPYKRGVLDNWRGKMQRDNPYEGMSGEHDWLDGWLDAQSGVVQRGREKLVISLKPIDLVHYNGRLGQVVTADNRQQVANLEMFDDGSKLSNIPYRNIGLAKTLSPSMIVELQSQGREYAQRYFETVAFYDGVNHQQSLESDSDQQFEQARKEWEGLQAQARKLGLDMTRLNQAWLRGKSSIKSKGKQMFNRKLWTKEKTAWLLKAEGEEIDPEMQEYLEEQGLDDIRIEDEPPPEEEGFEEQKAEEEGEENQQLSEDIDPDKACKILQDGEVDGKPLTEEQRGMFGAACARSRSFQKFLEKAEGEEEEEEEKLEESKTAKKSLTKGPAGFRALSKWIKQMEEDMQDLEQPQVLEAGKAAIKLFQKALGKAYKDLTVEEEESEEEMEEQDAKRAAKEANDEEDEYYGKKKSKRLSKAQGSILKDVAEFLEEAGENAPKHFGAGMKYHAQKLKELMEPDEPEEEAELTEEDEGRIEEAVAQLKNGETRLSEALFRATGKRIFN